MGLIARLAVARVHVLLVPVPGRPLLRMRAEAAIRARGWVLAATPADADALLVCGAPGIELAGVAESLWAQLPAPRARAAVRAADGIPAALDGLRSTLLAGGTAAPEAPPHEHDSQMSMTGPGGIPLAGGSEADRDGLEMDVLHLPLGPVLPGWPAGLLVELTLRGDVVLAATARVLAGEAAAEQPSAALDALDRAGRLLRAAGWVPPAQRLDRIRDRVLAEAPAAAQAAAVDRVLRQVRRSATLQWSIGRSGSGVDARIRLLAMLHEARAALDGIAEPDPHRDVTHLDVETLPALLVGRGLAEVRLLVAAAGGDPVPSREAVHRG